MDLCITQVVVFGPIYFDLFRIRKKTRDLTHEIKNPKTKKYVLFSKLLTFGSHNSPILILNEPYTYNVIITFTSSREIEVVSIGA